MKVDNKELLIYLHKRLSYLKKNFILFAYTRHKNEGKIEELEDIIRRIETGNFEYQDND
ncbi:hypothetical protein [Paenibacillus sp. BC26]|uniref:hypothetical protein n=1 Tax=Paenibacillus sp. BC26 TaxID=1881032 RepID=UPI0015A538C3|nr:hypothetical protein [Paenibacillus sp. BC26]